MRGSWYYILPPHFLCFYVRVYLTTLSLSSSPLSLSFRFFSFFLSLSFSFMFFSFFISLSFSFMFFSFFISLSISFTFPPFLLFYALLSILSLSCFHHSLSFKLSPFILVYPPTILSLL